MCSNYLFPNKRNLTLLGVDTIQFDLELKDHVFPSYHAPIILNGSEHLELDIACNAIDEYFTFVPNNRSAVGFKDYCASSSDYESVFVCYGLS